MLSSITKTTNFAAISSVGNENVMYMSASVNNRGEVSFAENIVDPELYRANKDEVDADLEEFKAEVLA